MNTDSKIKKVLVADKEETNVKLVQKVLEKENFNVLTTVKGCDVYDLVISEQPDLIIFDPSFKDEDGFKLLARIAAISNPRNIPILTYSVCDFPAFVRAVVECGAKDCIVKPIKNDELLKTVRSYINN